MSTNDLSAAAAYVLEAARYESLKATAEFAPDGSLRTNLTYGTLKRPVSPARLHLYVKVGLRIFDGELTAARGRRRAAGGDLITPEEKSAYAFMGNPCNLPEIYTAVAVELAYRDDVSVPTVAEFREDREQAGAIEVAGIVRDGDRRADQPAA